MNIDPAEQNKHNLEAEQEEAAENLSNEENGADFPEEQETSEDSSLASKELAEDDFLDPYEPEEDQHYAAYRPDLESTDLVNEAAEEIKTPEEEGEDRLTEVLEYLKLFLLVFLIALFITQYILQRNTVKGLSMYPTLNDGDELFVEKVSRYFGDIKRFDIITVDTKGIEHDEPNRVIKRVVGLPGDTVEIKGGQVYINGELLREDYLPDNVPTVSRNPKFDKVTLQENEYYCLGDNRNNSNDSRSFGPIPADHILGKLLVRFYPFDRIGKP